MIVKEEKGQRVLRPTDALKVISNGDVYGREIWLSLEADYSMWAEIEKPADPEPKQLDNTIEGDFEPLEDLSKNKSNLLN